MQLAIQTYTVRRELAEDIGETCERIRSLGIEAVELARVDWTQQTADRVVRSGLKVTSIQVKPVLLEADPDGIAAFCRTVGCPLVVASVLSTRAIFGGVRAIRKFAAELNELARMYAARGLAFAFHHHDFEFARAGGRRKFDILLEATDPAVKFVVDTYWVTKSGVDPALWIEALGARVIGLHLRDCVPRKGCAFAHDAPCGAGIVDFPAVLAAAAGHASYAAIEQNSKRPFDDLAQSIRYLRSNATTHFAFQEDSNAD
ncbi:MAG: hypothetical protein A2Y16_07195 [Tenericutes bacterium GWF2_57_13]|nr:MAG: hypothetical protein A2Y16_07195 [Tenericutes bacterium GWF2_57_13]